MSLKAILKNYRNSEFISNLSDKLKAKTKSKIECKGIESSLKNILTAALFQKTNSPILYLLNNKEEAIYVLNELELIFPKEDLLFYPASYRRAYEIEQTDNANVLLRAEVLNTIQGDNKPRIILSYPEALLEKVVTSKTLHKNTLQINKGDNLSLDFLNNVLFEYNFKRVDFVNEPGEFSVRGGIVDVFSFSNQHPYRVEFFGDEVESIRSFDVETQLSVKMYQNIDIIPNIDRKIDTEERESFLKYIGSKVLVIANNLTLAQEIIALNYAKAVLKFEELNQTINYPEPSKLFIQSEELKAELNNFNVLEFHASTILKNKIELELKSEPQLSFDKNIDLLISHLKENDSKGIKNLILCSNAKQIERFKTIFEDKELTLNIEYHSETIHQGFVDYSHKIACITDHQFFNRYHKFQLKRGFKKSESVTLKELNTLEKGDYVTHIDHGVAVFGGLQKIDVNGQKQEAIKLVYQNSDVLYVSIHSLHKISKFNGKDGKQPKIHKLGSPAWAKLKKKAQSKVKTIAYDLIELYAKRKVKKGFAFSKDTYVQNELEASFMYEDTPDQFLATQAVKKDMESSTPMDRLICGDVGFGKTEVAIRAAVKAAVDGKQVAILVPTTVLAFQHYKSFKNRIGDIPIKVNFLNRFKTAKQKREILEELENGQLDIIIGTHAIVSKNVKFKDLGLLIIDEEHKFGVAVKDKLKTIKENVDTLTLTATPIPRTMQFSLMAARDLSMIKTAPPNRQPIQTQIIGFNEEMIRDGISYELQRGGQVFFIHNRIENIQEVAGMIQRLVPDARVAIGHGRMDGKKLEDLMMRFIQGDFDVLVSTTIIESGLDVPNANTMFIHHAQNFGMADLHQMRGRVGRSNKKAFCYLVAPPLSAMTEEAAKRLQTLEQFSDLGSGFKIAMKDLEIRGAGNLLGGEQSGFMSDIGFETYQKILNETIQDLKENEFKDLYKNESLQSTTLNTDFVKDVQIDSDLEALIPDDYVNNIEERLSLYHELNSITNQLDLDKFRTNLKDRFGDLPIPAEDLLINIQLKWLAKLIGFEKVILKNNLMLAYFVANPQSKYYESPIFHQVISFMTQHPNLGIFKQKLSKNSDLPLVYLRFTNIDSVEKAYAVLGQIKAFLETNNT